MAAAASVADSRQASVERQSTSAEAAVASVIQAAFEDPASAMEVVDSEATVADTEVVTVRRSRNPDFTIRASRDVAYMAISLATHEVSAAVSVTNQDLTPFTSGKQARRFSRGLFALGRI